jgi:DNA topoisomerase-1
VTEADVPPPLPENFTKKCEKCGSEMVVKKSRQGSWFISCSGYPKCKNAKPFPSGIKCPKEGCDGEIVERSSKRGPFYGCSNYPKCRTIIKGKPINTPCPACGHAFMIENPKAKADPDAPALTCPVKDCGGVKA